MKLNLFTYIGIAALSVAACCRPASDTTDDIRISWDGSTYQELSELTLTDGTPSPNLYYPRVKRLSDGTLLMSYMDDHYGWNSFVAKSYDNGKTWTDAQCIRHRHPGVSTVGEDEVVFVNPDFIELQDGRIMLAHQWRYKAGYNDLPHTNENCGIEVMFSSDKGLTWTEAREVYRGRCWEPAMLQLPSGEIQMYITDSQNVVNKMSCPKTVVIRSFDGGATWQGKPSCTWKDVEGISHTRDDRFGYDGMPSGVRLDDGTIAVPLEVWSGKFVVDVTPVVVKTTAEDNWNLDQEKLLAEGGPDYPAKKQVNKDFQGYGPYSARLDSGEMLILSNGNYKGESGVWVFVGDKHADNFHHATRPFDGYWGCIDYIGDNEVFASGTLRYSDGEKTRGRLHLMKGRVNRSLEITKGGLEMPALESFKPDASWWFLGKKFPSAVYASLGYTADALEFGALVYDEKITVYTVENSDAAVLFFARGENVYKVAVNADGCWNLYELERWSWHLIGSGEGACVQLAGTIEADGDEDLGFSAKVSIPWSLIGGAPRRGETLRAHLCRMYKHSSSEKPAAIFEELEGENGDYPCDWLRVTLK
ncbi:MAG: exo-alpha-sialidase [Bacteroidales bacterium]|nr:exo-alpha-sialidase [Bacteroidales bacterium]